MKYKILLVDDEVSILRSLTRLLRQDRYEILTAESGKEAIEILRSQEDLAVIVSDQYMPEINGAQVLIEAYKTHPNADRIALTGYAKPEIIMDCINKGKVSRFLLKPWDDDVLRQNIRDSIETYKLKVENKRLSDLVQTQNFELKKMNSLLKDRVDKRTDELIEAKENSLKALGNFQKVLIRLMELHEPGLKGHGGRVADISRLLASKAGCTPFEVEAIETAALLHDVGLISLPYRVLNKTYSVLTAKEKKEFQHHPLIGYEILNDISGFEEVALIVKHHHEEISGDGYPDYLEGDEIPLGAKIIAIADSYDRCLYPPGKPLVGNMRQAVKILKEGSGSKFDPELVEIFFKLISNFRNIGELELSADHLSPGMVLSRDIINVIGEPLLRQNTELTSELIEQIKEITFKRENVGFDLPVGRIFINKSSIPKQKCELFGEERISIFDNQNYFSKTKEIEKSEVIISNSKNLARSNNKYKSSNKNEPLVLIVDDEQSVVNALKRELKRSGFSVDGYVKALEALRILRSEQKKVLAVITDLNMPGISGEKFLYQLNKEFPNLPCLVITGQATADKVTNLASFANIKRLFPKPWDKDELVATLNRLDNNK